MKFIQKFPALIQFFGAYFNQDAGLDYPNLNQALEAFKGENSPETIFLVNEELDQLLSLDLDNNMLTQALLELGCEYWHNFHEPETSKEWLKKIKMRLLPSHQESSR